MDYIDSLCVPSYQKKLIGGLLTQLTEHLECLPKSEIIALNELDNWFKLNSINYPIFRKPIKVDGNFIFIPPKKFSIVGSYVYQTCLTDKPTIDVAVKIPSSFWNAKDNFNQRYLRKRAFYIAYIGCNLKDHKNDLFKKVQFSYDYHPMRPVLLLKPADVNIKFHIRLLPITKEPFNISRFLPDRNNIRPYWYFDQPETKENENSNYDGTPFYNSLVLHDLNFIPNHKLIKSHVTSNEDIRKCIILIKTWCQRKGYKNLLEFPLTLFTVYLLRKGILTHKMNFVQLFRKLLLQFADSKWNDEPIYLCDEEPPFMEHFKKSHEVIFLDESGRYNICYLLPKDIYFGAKFEARITLGKLDSDFSQSIITALSPTNFNEMFDNILILNGSCIKSTCQSIESSELSIMDNCGQMAPFFVNHVINILTQALGDRVKLIQHKARNYSSLSWDISKPAPSISKTFPNIKFGLIFDQSKMLDTVIKGPPADQPEAEAFRKFWGDKSELRRFQEGLICETVYWESTNFAERRAIIGKIIKYVLQKHASISRKFIQVTGAQLDSFLWPTKLPPKGYGTGEEANKLVVLNFENLSRKLRSLKNLPLTLSSVQGVSPAFRGTDVFPPDSINLKYSLNLYSEKENCVIFKEDTRNVHPPLIEPIDVIIHLETSGKWPSDLEALKRVKAAFILELCEILSTQCGLMCRPQKRYLDIWHEGMVFRAHIGCNKEIHLMRHIKTPEGMIKTIESKEADHLAQFSVHLPIITSALNSINTSFTAFSCVCRLAKRWISRHLLSDVIDNVAIELMVAYIFLHPFPYTAPMSPMTGFLRFLKLLFSFPWNCKPLIVNFNDELESEDYQQIESYFKENRDQLPPVFIATPFDKKKSMWTQEKPLKAVVSRFSFLANKCYDYYQSCIENIWKADFQPLFHTNTEIFDLTICLNKKHIPNFHLNLNFVRNMVVEDEPSKKKSNLDKFPIVAFNPVECYLTELRKHFSKYALFFYDCYGGNKIYLIWKPHTFDIKPLYLSEANDCKLSGTVSKNQKPNIVLNVEAILEDLYFLGDGLVTSVDANVSKWE